MLRYFPERSGTSGIICAVPIDHVSLKFLVSLAVSGVVLEAFDGVQRLGHWVLTIRGELVSVGLGVGQHDCMQKRGDLGGIVVVARHMQIVNVAYERIATYTVGVRELGAHTSGQGNEFIRSRLDD